MTKRRRASEIILGCKRGFKYPIDVAAVLSGTGTVATKGCITLVATTGASGTWGANVAYITVSSGTNIGTLIGTNVGGF